MKTSIDSLCALAYQQIRPGPARGFDNAEYARRLERVQSAMVHSNIDVLLLTTEADFRYVSGFQTPFWQSPTRPWFLVVPASGKPTAVIPSIGVHCMQQTWIDDIRSWSSPHPTDDGVSLLAEALLEHAGAQGNVGLPMGGGTQLRMPLADLDTLQAQLHGFRWVDATSVIRDTRQIKSDAEVDEIRHCCHSVFRVFEALPNYIHSGLSEIEVFRRFRLACLLEGVDDIVYLVGGAGPGGYGDIISPPSSRPLQGGDVLILDTGCHWDDYYCDFDRNFAVLTRDPKAEQAHQVVWQATEAGLAAARPGVRCSEVFNTMQELMQPWEMRSGDVDRDSVGRMGHGLGSQLTEPPSLIASDDTIIEPGMVLTLEPGYTFAKGRMMVHEENIVVRDSGAELLTIRAPEHMPLNE